MDDLSGQVIKGYELRVRIGVGGFGTVYRAYQPSVQRDVAVKVIHPWLALDPAFSRRFETEAYLIARLEHPHIIPLYDYWRAASRAYLVMRWLGGGSLREKLKNGPLSVEQVAALLPQVTSALALAHRHNILHRDLKPDNILLDDESNAYLTDFGIAKDLTSQHSDTPAGEVMGTPDYLAPEQFLGDPLSPQTDIYSLGLVLYELLTGALPHGKLPQSELRRKRLNEPLPPLQQRRSDLPDSLNQVIQWATQREPTNRCPDARALADAFNRALLSTGPTLVVAQPPSVASALKAKFYQKAELVLEKPQRLIGRDDLLVRVHHLLDEGERVLLCGMGGIGKTSLAATIAAERIAAGKGPVIWLEAGADNADTLFEALARAFDRHQDIARKTGDERIAAIRELLLEKKALLVLDNVWNEHALFHAQKAIPPGLPLLVTSRRAMPLDGVVVEVHELDADRALELLSHHARRAFNADSAARALCHKLGHHPFALEIAGKRLKVDSRLKPAQLLDSIADAPHNLKLPEHFADAGREGVKELLDHSVNELPPDSRTAFVAMGGLFAPHATLDLFALVLGCEQDVVETMLADLQQRGLIERLPRANRRPAHYHLHDLTYSYARALFASTGQDHQPLIRAAQRYVTTHARAFDDLDFEQSNLLGAAKVAHKTGDSNALIHIMNVLATGGYLDARGHTLLLLERLDEAIEAIRQLDDDQNETLHFLLQKRASAYDTRGDLANALKAYEESLELAAQPQRKTALLCLIGGARFRQGAEDYEEYYQQAYQIAKANNDDGMLLQVLIDRGCIATEKGDHKAAHQFLTQAVKVAEGVMDLGKLFFALYNLGIVEIELGRFEQALSIHRRALQIAHDANNLHWRALALSGMGRGYHNLDDRQQAQSHFEAALEFYSKVGDTTRVAWVTSFMEKENYLIKADALLNS